VFTVVIGESLYLYSTIDTYSQQFTSPSNTDQYKVLSESPWTVVVVTASVKEDEMGGQGHTSASLLL
jgi:hypothetical protein